ncbi:hypothetical protein [Cupriavidus basilensis]
MGVPDKVREAAPVAVITALTLMLAGAFNVSVLASHATASFTKMLPPGDSVYPPPWPAAIVTLLVASRPLSTAPVMSPPDAAIVKSFGSSNHEPVLPCGARVSTIALSLIFSCEADVSTNPPSPPSLPPRALMVPSTVVRLLALPRSAIAITLPPLPALCAAASALMLPLCWMASLASRRTVPPSLLRPVASSVPVLRTTPPCRRSAACADRMISPPGARTALPFSTSAAMVAGVTRILASVRLPPNCNS